MTEHASHDEYIDAAPERFRPALRALRAAITTALPDADEVIAYGMPGFRVGDATMIGYAAFSKQCGLYLPAEAVAECAEAIEDAGLKHTKTGVTFTDSTPIPGELLTGLLDAARRSVGS
ncbi:iron chaperone [Demequina silvatica]|uniref:iron chaperone n=1 Tax=Demequina silvatica TaxID=1638988 RepID=UPI000781F4D5|nr:DUF1801 domain-containing protein [Demequina silvatica]